MKKLLTILILCLLCLPAFAQTPHDDKATVYIYKTWHVNTLGRAAFDVFIDDKVVAKLDRGIFLEAKLAPGKHSFFTKNKRSGGVVVDTEAGKVYYLRLQTDSGVGVDNPRINIPSKEESEFDMKQMKPIEKKDIKDPLTVFIPAKQN
jgi:hypothetical protein